MPDRRIRRIVLGGDELYVLVLEPQVVDRFLDEVGVLVSYGAELGGGHTNEQYSVAGMTVAGRLQPGVVGMTVDFLFERIEDAHPGVRDDGGTGNGHCFKQNAERR